MLATSRLSRSTAARVIVVCLGWYCIEVQDQIRKVNIESFYQALIMIWAQDSVQIKFTMTRLYQISSIGHGSSM